MRVPLLHLQPRAASEKGLVVANHILALMLIKGLGVELDVDEAIDYLTQGAYEGDESCLNLLKKIRPKLWKEINSKLENILDMRSALISLVSDMEPKGNQSYFLDIINAYRERFNEDYQKELNKQLKLDSIEVFENMALLATVGVGMSYRLGVAAKLFTALADAKVNIRMIDQGSSEMNIIVGVENDDFETATRAIYKAFVE